MDLSSSLIEAIDEVDYDRALTLLEHGADPNTMFITEEPILLWVATNPSALIPGADQFSQMVKLISRLAELGVNLNVEDSAREGLIGKCFYAHIPVDVIRDLIKLGAPVTNSKGDLMKGSLLGLAYCEEPDYFMRAIDMLSEVAGNDLTPPRLGPLLVDRFIHGQNDHSGWEDEQMEVYIPIADKLLNLGADINARSVSGHTALMRAAMNVLPNIVLFLLSKGANPNLQSDDGNTALHFVCGLLPEVSDRGDEWVYSPCHLDIAKSLIATGADKHILNNKRQTALDLAKSSKSRELVDFLA